MGTLRRESQRRLFVEHGSHAGTYTLSFGTLDVPWDGTIDYSGAFSIPQPDVPFWSGGDSGNIERPLPASGLALQGQDTYPLNKPPIVHGSLASRQSTSPI